MRNLKNIIIVCYKGYYYMTNKVGGTWFLGRPCTKLGWIIYTLKEEKVAQLKVVKAKDWTYQGIPMPPVTQEEIDTFFSLKEKKLLALKEFTKNKPNYL